MGVLRPLINRLQTEPRENKTQNDSWFTPANFMSVSRPILALAAGRMLIKNQKGASLVTGLMAASDMEGSVARAIDRKWPASNMGTSSKGAMLDKYADALSMLIVSGSVLRSKNISSIGKFSVGLILAQEGYKTIWAGARAAQYAKQSGGELLEVPVTNDGKEAMAEKFLAIQSTVVGSDVDNHCLNFALNASSLLFAVAGTIRGERVRRQYQETIDHMLAKNTPQNISI